LFISRLPDFAEIVGLILRMNADFVLLLRRIEGILSARERRMSKYTYQLEAWPDFTWDAAALSDRLGTVHNLQQQLLRRMAVLGLHLRAEATLQSLTAEVVKSSEIEGEILDENQVRSSIASRLGIEIGAVTPSGRDVDGIVEMLLDATQNFMEPLTPERLFGWHASLFPTGYSGLHKIHAGQWRDDRGGPMQVVSGSMGREKVHFQAPPASTLDAEMNAFLKWFNTFDGTDLVLRAGIAHLWFVTVHPFEDGNGRTARAIADMALARSEKTTQRFYSMSAQIRIERAEYYRLLESTQKQEDLDITPWLDWFLACLGRALQGADKVLSNVLEKARFWDIHKNVVFNERQRVVVNRLLGPFEGKLTSSKWAVLAKCSQDTASRDIDDLIKHGVLVKDEAGGRSTSYSLKHAPE
jgi:Fic family protein